MAMWNPWHGCKKISVGCKYCYIYKGDFKRGIDTSVITKNNSQFDVPVAKKKNGEYKISSGSLVYLCFSSDFFIEDADMWRNKCWDMIRTRSDLTFIFLTKRILRFYDCIPSDWGDGYENVIIGCTVCNQKDVDTKLSYFQELPIKHKNIICQPLLEQIDVQKYLKGTELLVVGGESDKYARPLNYEWVTNLRKQCEKNQVDFEFRQCGTHFIKEGNVFTLQTKDLCSQAKKANINLHFNKKQQL